LRRSLIIVLIFAAAAAAADKPPHVFRTITGKVVGVADGDTLAVLDNAMTKHKILLAGSDAPEKGQPFGTKTREALSSKVFGQAVRVDVIDIDRYQREVGRIDQGEHDVNAELVGEGFAWWYFRFDQAGEFTAAGPKARKAKRG